MPEETYTWDFFIAHAGCDTPVAEVLYDALRSKCRIFLDSKCLKLGDNWDQELATAQRQSRVTVVLISANTDNAYYQREEIAAAIKLSRNTGQKYRVIPIFLDKTQDIPYGLTLKHGITIAENSDPKAAAERLLDFLDSLEGSPEWVKYAPKPPSLPDGKRWHVFLSYRGQHHLWVIKLYDALLKAGFKSWFPSQEVIPGKDTLGAIIGEALESCIGAIMVWPSFQEHREWARIEFEKLINWSRANPQSRFIVVVFEEDKDICPGFVFGMPLVFGDPEGPSAPQLLYIMYGLSGMPMSIEAVKFIERTRGEIQAQLDRIAGARIVGDRERLQEIGKGDAIAWVSSPLIFYRAAHALIELGSYDSALEILSVAEKQFPKSLRLNQLRALCFAHVGRCFDAQRLIAATFSIGHRDLNTLLILAYTWMNRYLESKRRLHLEKSWSLYKDAFANTPGDYYAGVNVAAKSIILGEKGLAYEYAEKTESALVTVKTGSALVTVSMSQEFLKIATLAEIKLIREDYAEASRLYKEAMLVDPEAIGLHQDYLAEARVLMEALNTPAEQRLQIEETLSA
jgi:tetratricopeptide (TPR) repeat protein